jgi:hypothetical protein
LIFLLANELPSDLLQYELEILRSFLELLFSTLPISLSSSIAGGLADDNSMLKLRKQVVCLRAVRDEVSLLSKSLAASIADVAGMNKSSNSQQALAGAADNEIAAATTTIKKGNSPTVSSRTIRALLPIAALHGKVFQSLMLCSNGLVVAVNLAFHRVHVQRRIHVVPYYAQLIVIMPSVYSYHAFCIFLSCILYIIIILTQLEWFQCGVVVETDSSDDIRGGGNVDQRLSDEKKTKSLISKRITPPPPPPVDASSGYTCGLWLLFHYMTGWLGICLLIIAFVVCNIWS